MRARRTIVATLAAAALSLLATPAGAQQLVDAGGEHQGGLAFVLFAGMVFVIAGALFFMDHVRRRASDDPS